MRKLLLIFVLSFSVLSTSMSKENHSSFEWLKIRPTQSFQNFKWSNLPEGISAEMVLSLIESPIVSSNDPITILPIKDEYFALFPCRLEVFKWNGKEWKNLYMGYSAGNNCGAHFFLQNGVLFSYGRYGFWHAHSELMFFDFQKGSWENLPAKNSPMNYAGVSVFKKNGNLLTMMGQYIHQSSGLFKFEKDGFYFDFEKGGWYPIIVNIPGLLMDTNWGNPSFDLLDYGIQLFKFQAEMGLLIFDKIDLKFYFSRMDYTPLFTESISFSRGNELWFFDEKGGSIFLDFKNGLDSSFQVIGEIELVENWDFDEKESIEGLKNGIIIFLILITIGLVGLIFLRDRNKKKESFNWTPILKGSSSKDVPDEEINRTIILLTEYRNQSFDVDGFDRILGIDQIENLDYKRVKRNRLIKSVNDKYSSIYGRNLIDRSRFKEDKRVVLYKILE